MASRFQNSHFQPERTSTSSPPPRKKTSLTPTEAAVMVQAAARGFSARRTVGTVRAVEAAAGEIAGRIAAEGAAIGGDVREASRVEEMLVLLLIRLDCVRGAAEYRRRVYQKVMALLDAVEAMAAVRAPEAHMLQ